MPVAHKGLCYFDLQVAGQTRRKETRLKYEMVYIVRPTVDEQALAVVREKIDKFITTNGGTLTQRDDWGKRQLAFPISKCNEGFYTVLKLEFPPNAVRILERSLQLTEEVLRYLVVRDEGFASAPPLPPRSFEPRGPYPPRDDYARGRPDTRPNRPSNP